MEPLETRTLYSVSAVDHMASALSVPRESPATAAVGSNGFFIGGRSSNSLDATDIYDSSSGLFSTAALPEPGEGAAFHVGDKLTFIGGDDTRPDRIRFHVDTYHAASGKWTTAAAPRLTGGAATRIGHLIVYTAIAGSNGRFARVYSVDTGRWTSIPPPTPIFDSGTLFRGNLVYNLPEGMNSVAIFHPRSMQWSIHRLPPLATSVAVNAIPGDEWILGGFSPSEGLLNQVGIFDPDTGRLVQLQLSQPRGAVVTEVVGTKVLFIGGSFKDASGNRQQSSVIDIYDAATGTWSTGTCPARDFTGIPPARLGEKLIFPPADDGTTVVDVYDTRSAEWSTAPFSTDFRAAMGIALVGTQAIFGGGVNPSRGTSLQESVTPVDNVDIYTDLHPAPVLSGELAERQKRTVAINNAGDADLPAGATVALYASPSRTLEPASVLIGQTTLTSPLAAGSSIQVSIPTSLKSLAPGQYHLVAAVDDHSGPAPTPIASEPGTFTIFAKHAGASLSRQSANSAGHTHSIMLQSPEEVPQGVSMLYVLEPLEPRRLLAAGIRTGLDLIALRTGPHGAANSTPPPPINGGVRHTVASPSNAHWDFAATSAGPYALFAGGNAKPYGYGTYSDAVEIYDSRTSRWSTATLSEPRRLLAAASVDGKAIFAGGDSIDGRSSAVDIFDSATGRWSTCTLPHIRDGSGAASVGHLAIFAGGGYADASSDTADVYNALTGQWSSVALPRPLRDVFTVGTAACGQAIFTDGAIAEIYDVTTGRWSVADLPQELGISSATAVGTKVIFIGADDGICDVYDAATGQWSTLHLPHPRTVAAVTALGSKAIFAGGIQSLPLNSDIVDVYDTTTGTWSTADPLTEARYSMAATSVGRKAIFLGGHTSDQSFGSLVADVYTDASPALSLDGTVVGQGAGGPVTVTVRNSGDAPLFAGAKLAVYAVADGQPLAPSGPPIGQVALRRALLPGASLNLTIATAVPTSSSAIDHLRLVAAVSRHALTPVAASAPAPLSPAPFIDMPIQLPSAPIAGSAVAAGNKAIFSDFFDTATQAYDGIDVFNATTGTFTATTLPHVPGDAVVTAGSDKVLFAGGTMIDLANGWSPFADGRTTVDLFDTTTGQWSTANLSQSRLLMTTASVGEKAIFAGGLAWTSASGDGPASDAIDIYNARTGQWSTATLSQPRVGMVSAVVGGKAILAGGRNFATGASSAVDIYDSATGLWSTSTLPAGTDLEQSFGYASPAIAAGGKALFSTGSEILIYDPAANQWTTAAKPPFDLGSAIASLGNLAFFAVSQTIQIYNVQTNTWSRTTLPNTLSILGATTLGTQVLFLGDDGGGSGHNDADIYDTATGEWSMITLSTTYSQARVLTVGGRVVIVPAADDHTPGPTPADVLIPIAGTP
jgi:hypothetical protein